MAKINQRNALTITEIKAKSCSWSQQHLSINAEQLSPMNERPGDNTSLSSFVALPHSLSLSGGVSDPSYAVDISALAAILTSLPLALLSKRNQSKDEFFLQRMRSSTGWSIDPLSQAFVMSYVWTPSTPFLTFLLSLVQTMECGQTFGSPHPPSLGKGRRTPKLPNNVNTGEAVWFLIEIVRWFGERLQLQKDGGTRQKLRQNRIINSIRVLNNYSPFYAAL